MSTVVFVSCENADGAKKVVAKAYGLNLTVADITGIVKPGTSAKDSSKLMQMYLQNWLKQQVLLHKAQDILTENEKNKEQQVADYKNALLIYELEKRLLSQGDTAVPLSEIRNYYHQNRKEFELKKNIVRLNYIKVRKNSPRLDKVKLWFYSPAPEARKNLEGYAALYAENYFFADSVWLAFDEIQKEIPLRGYDEEQFLRSNNKTILEDAAYNYFIDIREFRIREDVSPFAYEVSRIRNILANKKKLDLIQKQENQLLKEAQDAGDVEIVK
ncbi:MAG: hypothetical protein EXR21_06255 [Flavobacteriaceae bacterium]|nr:hypothetical protein [Flavobacteriaceae bacterium]